MFCLLAFRRRRECRAADDIGRMSPLNDIAVYYGFHSSFEDGSRIVLKSDYATYDLRVQQPPAGL